MKIRTGIITKAAKQLSIVLMALSGSLTGVNATADKAPLVIAAYDSRPYTWYLEDGTLVGTTTIVMERFIEAIGGDYQPSYRLGSLQRNSDDIINGRADCAFLFATPEMTEHAVPISSKLTMAMELWSLKSQPVKSLHTENPMHVVTTYTHRNLLDGHDHKLTLVSFTENLVAMLLSRRADAIISSDYSAQFRAHLSGTPLTNFHQVSLQQLGYYFYCGKKSLYADQFPLWRQRAAEVLSQINVQDVTFELVRRYEERVNHP